METTDDGYAVDRRRTSVVDAVWRHRWVVLGAAVLAGLLGFAASFLQSREYSAAAQLILTDPRAAPDALRASRDAQRYIANQAEFIETSVVAERASELLDGTPGPAAVKNSVSAASTGNLDVITIAAVRPTAQEAAAVANAVGQAYEELVTSTITDSVEAARAQLDGSILAYEEQITAIDELLTGEEPNEELLGQRSSLVSRLATAQSQVDELVVEATLFGSGVQLFEQADVPASPSNPQPLRNAAAAAVVGLLGAGAYGWWRSERSPLVFDRHEPADVFGAPLLGVVPAFRPDEGHRFAVAGLQHREAFDFVMSAFDFALDEVGGSVVAVTSPGSGEGRTATLVNLALAAVTDGRKPLLVDANRRHHGLSDLVPGSPGLSELAAGNSDIEDCLAEVEFPDANLTIMPFGSAEPAPAGFFRNAEFKKAMAAIRARGRLTLVDTPPVLAAAEVPDIAAQSDAVVIVVKAGTALRALEDARDRLTLAGTPLLGYVFYTARGPAQAFDDDDDEAAPSRDEET